MFDVFSLFFFLSLPPLYHPYPAQINVESIVEIAGCPCDVVQTDGVLFTTPNRSGITHPRVVQMFVLC